MPLRLNPQSDPAALGVVSGMLLVAVFDMLKEKGLIDSADIKGVIETAYVANSLRTKNAMRDRCDFILQDLRTSFAKG